VIISRPIIVRQLFFREGTRNRSKKHSLKGLKFCAAPSAYVVPVSINNSWKMVKFGFSSWFRKSSYLAMHKPLKVSDFEDLMQRRKKAVVEGIKL
jgi:1-acyl-sn-glycerol-3-phosphate acyltransferase